LGRLLTSHQYQVLRAQSVEEAFALAARGPHIDLVLCDVHMPEIPGADCIDYFRSRGLKAPVIFITADTDELLEAELALKGAYAVFRKGSDLRILLAWIRNAELRNRERQAERFGGQQDG
jgi:DNA-binding response OmpR family regulator